MWRRKLLPLTVATFAVGTDGFVVAGLLPGIAADVGVGVPAAGQLITVFGLTLAVSAPVLGAATSALDRRRTLLLGLLVFCAGNAVTALGTTFGVLLGGRVTAAAGAGLISAAAFSAAVAVAPPGRQGRALAVVMGGLTVSTALGLPLGTLIGSTDWRITLWAVTGLGVVAAAGVVVTLPPVVLPATTLRERIRPLGSPWVLAVLTVTVLTLAGTHVLYTYVAAALAGATGGSTTALTVVLLAWGLGNVAGNLLAGVQADRFPPERVVLGGLCAAAVVLAVSPLLVGSMPAATAWALAWGVCVSAPVVPQQARLAGHAPAAAAVLIGLNSSAIYLGIATGGALGGALQPALAPAQLGLAGAALSVAGVLVTLTTMRRRGAPARFTR